jgi:LmbE family N-acetylglucosaminyl deacetylase
MGVGTRVMRCVVRGLMITLFLTSLSTDSFAQFPPAPGTGPGLADTIEAIDAARVTTRILYITAHPDDESAAVLTYLARGLHADVALLSLTRGEGGQNALGPEQAPQLGLIRTQELLAATRGYGVKLYFTRAKDFGFSKTPEETEKIWGDEVLLDMVRIIRSFRPNIVINGWGGVHGGHGHHQAASLLTPKAVQLAADPSYLRCADCPDLWSTPFGPVTILDLDRMSENPAGYVLPLDEVSPLWGKSWRQIGLEAFLNHQTQGIPGVLNSPFWRRPIALKREDGETFDPLILSEPLPRFWTVLPMHNEVFRRVDELLQIGRDQALKLDWISAERTIATAAREIEKECRTLSDPSDSAEQLLRTEIEPTVNRIQTALTLVAGVAVTALSDKGTVSADDEFSVTVTSKCRSAANCKLGPPVLELPGGMKETQRKEMPPNSTILTVGIGHEVETSRWNIGEVGDKSLAALSQRITVGDYGFNLRIPVEHLAATSTRVSRVRLQLAPKYTLMVEPKQEIEVLARQRKPFDVLLRVHSYSTKTAEVSVGLDVPVGWTSSAPVETKFAGIGDRYVKLAVTPPKILAPGNYKLAAYAKRGDEKFTTSLEPLPSMPTELWEEPAQCVAHAFDVKVPEGLRVGYITAESEPIPESLRMLGIQVETLDATALNFGDLKKFDAIVVGVRAYELRPELPGANQRLLDYVTNGGTLVVQYNRDVIWDKLQPGPYPALVSPPIPPAKDGAVQTPRPLPRITDENSPVKFLKPEDPLLNSPNQITQEDFKGWVQERGLYYWTEFDPKYTPLLEMNDPGEPELNGGLVYTLLGKGTYIYTGLAFFRQLPEGVPGAYRLFVNLLSASRNK